LSAGRQFSPSPPIQPVRVALAVLLARRIGWPYSEGPLKKLLARIRPEYVGIDPVDRVTYEPGQIAQCDLWFPETPVPVTAGQARVLPVLVVTLAFSRFLSATMIHSRQAGDILSGMWQLISGIGRVPKTLVWDRESAIGGTGRVSAPAAAFAETLATRIRLAPPRDPEFKGMVERNNGFFETSFLPGRAFAGPDDFNDQLAARLPRANSRIIRALQARLADLLETDRQAMTPLPPLAPPVGLTHRIRLARDYYVRVDTCDYSVDPRAIGRFVDVTASPTRVQVFCGGQLVADHHRSWAKHAVVSDPVHVATAHQMRLALAEQRRVQRQQPAETVAVLRFSGDRSPRAVAARTTELREALRAEGTEADGPVVRLSVCAATTSRAEVRRGRNRLSPLPRPVLRPPAGGPPGARARRATPG
jgi:hypothetical protein